MDLTTSRVSRAQGCLLGQLAGDSLGSLVEFRGSEEIRRLYPGGLRELADGGTWGTIAGQPTDDSEMALSLARSLVERREFDVDAIRQAYCEWLDSGPFDSGTTVASGLKGLPNADSQANGAMMRVSPLGIFGAGRDLEQVGEWARLDAALTHPNAVCMEANRLYVMAIARAIWEGLTAAELSETILQWAKERGVPRSLVVTVERAQTARPAEYVRQQGWVLIAFGNALWQLRHAGDLEEAVVDTVMQGGDTDTNAAICGALLGAVYGREAIPEQWVERVVSCRPDAQSPRPRPECFWPADCLELAMRLCGGS